MLENIIDERKDRIAKIMKKGMENEEFDIVNKID